jgi:hydrogenase-4 membrane subunit HyfE
MKLNGFSMSDFVIRFLIGGIVVSSFAIIGDILRPKSFAGLFGAAPSIALATLGLTISQHGGRYAAIEAHSMVLGAFAFFIYTVCVSWVLARHKTAALPAAIFLMPVWFGVSLGLWHWWGRIG